MDICFKLIEKATLSEWLSFLVIILGVTLSVFWVFVIASNLKSFDPPLICRSRIFRLLMSLHGKYLGIPISVTLLMAGWVLLVDNFRFLIVCQNPTQPMDVPGLFTCFFVPLVLWVFFARGQGLPFRLNESLRMSWDRKNQLQLHLSGPVPRAISKKYILKSALELHSHLTQLRRHNIYNTTVLESWLFLRKAITVSPRLIQLRQKLYFADLHIAHSRAAKVQNKQKRLALLFVLKLRIAGRLILSSQEIYQLMSQICVKDLMLDRSDHRRLPQADVDTFVHSLSLLDSSYRFEERPIKKLNLVTVFMLIIHYPHIGKYFVPFSTGIEIK